MTFEDFLDMMSTFSESVMHILMKKFLSNMSIPLQNVNFIRKEVRNFHVIVFPAIYKYIIIIILLQGSQKCKSGIRLQDLW